MKSNQASSRNLTLLLGIGLGVGLSVLLALIYLIASGNLTWPSRAAAPPTIQGVTLTDPTGDQLDKAGVPVSGAPGYLDMIGATITVGDPAILQESKPDAAPTEKLTPLVASVVITMAQAIPPPAEQATIFSLGVSVDRDGDASNNDTQTPGLIGTDTTIAINCDPTHSRCLEGIATFTDNNWSAQAAPITWQIDGNVVKLAFRLDFLPAGVEAVGWRVYASVVDPGQGGPFATDVIPAVDAPLAKLITQP